MIFFETAGQARTFLLLLYAGFGAGVLYDVLALPRRALPRFCQPGLDALWCLMTGAAAALVLAAGGESAFRLYSLLGLVCGAAVYWLGIRALIRGIVRFFKRNKNLQ
ncbi:MAG: hypothetical protein IK099_15020 [Clostridia bacterium]|nr:hypothetical protein [Clostridia bacterium]